MPYLIENLEQYNLDAAKKNAIELVHATIVINNMDFKHYQASGQVKMRDGFADGLQRTWNTDDINTAAIKQFDAMHVHEVPAFTNLVMHDLALLKMVEIGLTLMKYQDRVKAFDTFMSELDFYRPSLMVLARLFFHGKMGNLLKANVGDRNFKIPRLHGAAYDLFISTIPEQMLGMSNVEHPQLTVVATNDAGLTEFAGRFPVRGIAIQKNGLHRILQDWDEPWLDATVGQTNAEEIRKSVGDAAAVFGAAVGSKSLDELQAIAAALEKSLHSMAA